MERACSNCVPDKVAWEVHFSIVILMPLYSWFNARSLSFDRKYCSFSPQLCAPQRNHSQLSNWIEQFKEVFFCLFFYCELWVLIWETFRGYKHIRGILFQFILDVVICSTTEVHMWTSVELGSSPCIYFSWKPAAVSDKLG